MEITALKKRGIRIEYIGLPFRVFMFYVINSEGESKMKELSQKLREILDEK